MGEKNEQMRELLKDFARTLPEKKPRYLMGVGTPLDIMHAISQGVDMFDCVLPTRNARNGQFLTNGGPLNIKKERFKEDLLPPDPDCDCRVCKGYSRAYIRHLFTVGEYLAGQMISFHNLYFYKTLVNHAREAIMQQKFDDFYQSFYKEYSSNKWK